MTDRSNISQKILEALGEETLSLHELAARVGTSDMGIRSALSSMRKRGEVWRHVTKDKRQLFTKSPLSKLESKRFRVNKDAMD